MFAKEIDELLHKSLPSVPQLIMERSLAHDIDDLVAQQLPAGCSIAIIDDYHTAEAYGEHVARALTARFSCQHITLPRNPIADRTTAQALKRRTASCDALIAVGSGTVSDLCKSVSFEDDKPYLVFPTAASMNGYLSANASLTVEGYKKTVTAHMPLALYCDLSVIAAAPLRLNKSGLGDALARPTAQADWLLSHFLLGTDYDETPFTLLQPLEGELFAQAKGLASNHPATLALLMKLLLLSGLGMTIAGGSYPASQGEHMIAHCLHMLPDSAARPATLHGEEIGVTTLTMAQLQQSLLRIPPRLRVEVFDDAAMTTLFGQTVAEEAREAFQQKQRLIAESTCLETALNQWDNLAARIESVAIPLIQLQTILQQAQAIHTMDGLGLAPEIYALAVTHARYLRDRFTFLDLA